MRKYLILILILGTLSTLFSQLAEQKIIPADNGSGDFFGRYLCLKGNDLLISAHQDDENGYASGSLYSFTQNEEGIFEERDKLIPEDGDVEEFFGYSIDISGNYAVTGSHHDSDFGGSSGSAFILEKVDGQWTFSQKIYPKDPRAGDEFAKSVGMDEDEIACGAFLDDDRNTNSGSVYIFKKMNDVWEQVQEIYPNDAQPYDQFGHFLTFNNGILLVGTPEKNMQGENLGCAYIFEKKDGEYQQSAQLILDDIMPGDHFGEAVTHNQEHIVVGAYKRDERAVDGGAVYIYSKMDSLWELKQVIVPEDNQEGDHFGSAVGIQDDLLAIGAYFDDDNGSKSGSVYIYKNNGEEFIFQKKILASDGSAGDAFGASLDIDGPNLVVGAYADSENGFFSGSAYIFHLPLLLSQKVVKKECESFNIWTDYPGRKLFINKDLEVNSTCKIYNLQGKQITSETTIFDTTISLPPNVAAGIYLLQLNLSCGQVIKKFYYGPY